MADGHSGSSSRRAGSQRRWHGAGDGTPGAAAEEPGWRLRRPRSIRGWRRWVTARVGGGTGAEAATAPAPAPSAATPSAAGLWREDVAYGCEVEAAHPIDAVSRPFPSWDRSTLAEIYLCHACSCHELLRAETAGQVLAGLRTSRGVSLHQILALLPPPPPPPTITAPSDTADSGGGDDAAAVDEATPASTSPLPDGLWAYLQQLQVCSLTMTLI
jgi:hypothetical protein